MGEWLEICPTDFPEGIDPPAATHRYDKSEKDNFLISSAEPSVFVASRHAIVRDETFFRSGHPPGTVFT